MKKILLVSLLFPFVVHSQGTFPIKDGKVVYEEIDSVVGATKNELYDRSKIWLANAFKSAKDVIQLDDKENGQVICKGNFEYYYTVLMSGATWVCNFSLQIDCRDNKSRIKIYDISAHSAGEATAEYFYEHHDKKHIKYINDNIISLLAHYKASISQSSKDNF